MTNLIKPSTILIIFCNVLIFMVAEILLFWYVISDAIENIISEKSSIVKEIIKNSTVLQEQINTYTQSPTYLQIYNQSIIDKEQRITYNINLTWQWMLIPFLFVIGVITVGILYTLYIHNYTSNNSLKLDKTDGILLTLMILSFLTEIIFIFVLVTRYEYISDLDIIIFLMNFYEEIPSGPTLAPFSIPILNYTLGPP